MWAKVCAAFSPSASGLEECRTLRRGPSRLLRIARICATLAVGSFVLGMLALAAVVVRLHWGPIEIGGLNDRIAEELGARVGQGFEFKLGKTELASDQSSPVLSVEQLSVQSASGRTVLVAPQARLTIDSLGLLLGRVRPTNLELSGLDLRLEIQPDGSVAVAAGTEPIVLSKAFGAGPPEDTGEARADQPPKPSVAAPASQAAVSRIAAAITAVLDVSNGEQSPLGMLENVSITNGRLILDDRTADRSTVFEGVSLSFARNPQGALLSFTTDGPAGQWAAKVQASGEPGAARALDVEVSDLSFDEITLAGGWRNPGLDIDMPLSVRARFEIGADGTLASAEGRFAAGAGYVFLHDPDAEPVFMDEATGAFRWQPASRAFTLDQAQFLSGETRVGLSGRILPPQDGSDAWSIELQTEPQTRFGPDRRGQTPVDIEKATASARYLPAERRLVVDRFEVLGPEISAAATIDVVMEEAGPHVRTALSVSRMPVRTLLRLWPSPVASPVRSYLLDNVLGGTIQGTLATDYTAEMLAMMRAQRPPPDTSTRVDFTVSNGMLTFLPGLPPLNGVEAVGRVTGRTANLTVNKGYVEVSGGRRINVAEGSFVAPDNAQRPPPAIVNARVTGNLEAISDLLARDAVKKFGGLVIDTSTFKGQVDGRLNIEMKLDKHPQPDNTQINVAANVSQLVIEKLVGKERLEQGSLAVNFDKSGMKVTGQGRLFGGPATLELQKAPNSANPDAIVNFALDDAARSRLGFTFGSALTGPVGVRVATAFTGSDQQPAHIDLDFARATIENLVPGFSKPGGRPAKASFLYTPGTNGSTIDQLTFDAPGGALAKGTIELDGAGALKSARLSQLRLSPGDDMRVEGDFTKDGSKLTVRGNSIDARPFIRSILGTDLAAKDQASKDLELDLRSPLVTGNNRQAYSNVELKLSRRGGAIRNLQLQARSGRSQLNGGIVRGQTGEPLVNLTTQDAGGLLAFLDLYKRMEGGRLQLAGHIDDRGIDGSFVVSEFVLRDEPALRRMVTEGVAARDERNALKIDTTAASFTRLAAGFTRTSSQLTIREGVIYGPQIGIKLDGTVDFARDQANLSGTFVPAYGLNNLFSQIPVFGPILGGGSNEGLFAVNFRISGQATAPMLTINPLSAIAPGMLRKIFGVGDFTAPTPPQPVPNAPMQLRPAR